MFSFKFIESIIISLFFDVKISNTPLLIFGTTSTSKKFLFISFAKFSSIFLLNKTTPPKALKGSDCNALRNAFLIFDAEATPQGLLCFIIIQVGSLNSFKQLNPSLISKMLL